MKTQRMNLLNKTVQLNNLLPSLIEFNSIKKHFPPQISRVCILYSVCTGDIQVKIIEILYLVFVTDTSWFFFIPSIYLSCWQIIKILTQIEKAFEQNRNKKSNEICNTKKGNWRKFECRKIRNKIIFRIDMHT